ncbi:MAG TPA: hypothetical protein VJN18_11035 [Polyangiaceae bacterium]|nr:hypothetical protein [Polyangiaceae bacterium]
MQEGTWQNVMMGADAPGVEARGTLQTSGPFLHAWLKFRLPGNTKVYMIHAAIDLREIEDALSDEIMSRGPAVQRAVAGGRIGRKIKEKLKSAAKKIAKSKLVQGLKKVAKKVINNPLVKGLISATPFGAAAMATATAARMAAKAIKGGKKVAQKLRRVAAGAAAGDPDAIRQARLLKQGLAQLRVLQQLVPRVVSGMDEPTYLAKIVSGCVDNPAIGCGIPPLIGCGAEGLSDDQEIEAFEEFATAGAFEGVRWLARRLGPHALNPNDFDRRDALYLGHQTMVRNALIH